MPGPDGPWGDALVAAVRDGRVALEAIDRKVLRLLALAARVGALEGFEPVAASPVEVEDGVAFAREAAAEGIVLVRNTGILPIEVAPARIAVIGHNALAARTQGGGSATVLPERVVSPLEAVRASFPDAEVVYEIGAVVQSGVAELPLAELENPVTGGPGVHVAFLDASGAELFAENRRSTALVWIGSEAPVERSASIRLRTRWTPSETTTVDFGFSAVGHARIEVGGVVLMDADVRAAGDDLGAALLSPGRETHPLAVEAGRTLDILIDYTRLAAPGFSGAATFAFGLGPSRAPADRLIADAIEAARAADLVLLVVGTNAAVESEGFDRESLALPGAQDELARQVLDANPNTVVLVNSGSPVELPWRDDAAAVLLGWFGGQEFGNAVVDVLTGRREPGGRLPTTWPDAQADVPVIDVTPRDGVVRYDEGIHIGYRAWLRAGAEPAYPFGFGLGYTGWERVRSGVSRHGDGFIVEVTVRNTGTRAGKQVVQVYASRAESAVDRPVRWLVGFGIARGAAGEHVTVHIPIPRRAFAHWSDGWCYEAGGYGLSVGFDAASSFATHSVAVA